MSVELRLLLIDDDEDAYVLVRDFIAETTVGWTVDWASTYERGIEGLATGHYAAALLDYHLGAKTGVDLLSAVRGMENLPPIVLLTGQGDRTIDLAAIAAGASDYLDKGSLSPVLLERTVRHAMERDRAAAALRASEAQYHGLFDRAGDAVLVADDTGQYVDANPAACELLGVTREAAIGRSLDDFVVPGAGIADPRAAWTAFLDVGEMRGQVRIRRPDGSVRDAEFRATANVTPGRHLSVLRDATERLAATKALTDSELRFRSSIESMLDPFAIMTAIRDDEGSVSDFELTFVNEPMARMLGLTVAEVTGSRLLTDWPANATNGLFEAYRAVVATGEPYLQDELTYEDVLSDGRRIRLSLDLRVVRLGDGIALTGREISAYLASQRDLQDSEERFRLLADRSRDVISKYRTTPEWSFEYVSPSVTALAGYTPEELLSDPSLVFGLIHADDRAAIAAKLDDGSLFSSPVIVRWARKDGSFVWTEQVYSEVLDEAGQRVAVEGVARDVTARREAEASQARLVAAIDQATETIIVTDETAHVVYANPAFARTSGYAVEELLGKDLWAFLRRAGSTTIHRRIASRLRSGRSWSGEWALQRRDGEAYREEVTVSPVRGASGAITSFVSVGRDVAQLREIQASLDENMRARVAFAHALARLEQRATAEETGQDLTDAMIEIPGVDIATVLAFEESGEARVVAFTAPRGYPLKVGETLPAARSAYLRTRASVAAWSETFAPLDRDAYSAAIRNMGIEAIAAAPFGGSDGLIGLVTVGTTDAAAARRWADQVPAMNEFAAAARGLIGSQLLERGRLRASQGRIRSVIAAGDFDPVFQPIVLLKSGAHIGYEALTRFRGGRPPDLVFAEASGAGLSLELETATLERAMAASTGLPDGRWLALNVSAAMVLDGSRLARLVGGCKRPIVLEITEHMAIDDYAAVRRAVARLGPDVSLAVDDAGAGVANFSHIVELRPTYVKIDASLISGVNDDLSRQALIVGLKYFAGATQGWVIAEGVETEAERRTLVELDVTLAQGYLFGRPAAVDAWQSPPPPPTPFGSATTARGALAARTI